MYIQGDLQKVFDALFNMGVIDPVLDADWVVEQKKMIEHHDEYEKAVSTANKYKGDVDGLMKELEKYDDKILGFLAMEVAREFSNFHGRKEVH
mgnify:CR=1 FL=1